MGPKIKIQIEIQSKKHSRSHKTPPKKRIRSSKTNVINKLPKLSLIEGNIMVVGTGDAGQLGLGEEVLFRKRLTPLLPELKFVDIVSGGMHSIAITKDGKLYSWGCNDHGALGRSGDEYRPLPVENLEGIKIVKVACCDSASLALTENGKIYSWGTFRTADGILGFSAKVRIQPTPILFKPLADQTVTDIAAGTDHCLALTETGRVYSWGDGLHFRLGRRVLERHLIHGTRPERLNLKGISLIGCGSYHSFAVTKDGKVYSWGLNNFQQCGSMEEEGPVVKVPSQVRSIEGHPIQVVGGEHHSFVLTESGLYGFGRADGDQLGLGEALVERVRLQETGEDVSRFKKAVGVPVKVPDLNVVQVSTNSDHTLAVGRLGCVYSWGFADCGALGRDGPSSIPGPLTGKHLEGKQIIKVAAGGQHSVVLALS